MASDDASDGDPRIPYPLAMVVCDAIYLDPHSGKRSLTGVFSVVRTDSFPVTVIALAVYVALSEWIGTHTLALQLVDMTEDAGPLFRMEAEQEYHDPLQVIEVDFRLGRVTFPAPGKYRLQLFAGDSLLHERLLLAVPFAEALSP